MIVVVGCYDGSIHGWETSIDVEKEEKQDVEESAEKLELSFAYSAHRSCTKCITLMKARNGDFMATGGTDEVIRVYNNKNKREVGELDKHTDQVMCLDFVGRKHMISGGKDGALCLWDAKTWQCIHTLKGHKPGPVTGIAVHPSGRVAFSTSRDNSLRMWDLVSGRPASRNRLQDFRQLGLPVWSNSGENYAVVGDDRHVLLFKINNDSGEPDASILYRSRVNTIGFLGEKFLAIGCEDGTIRVVNSKGKEVGRLDCSENSRVRSLEVVPSEDGNYYLIIAALAEGIIQFWRLSKDMKNIKQLEKKLKVGSTTHVTCMTAITYSKENDSLKGVKVSKVSGKRTLQGDQVSRKKQKKKASRTR